MEIWYTVFFVFFGLFTGLMFIGYLVKKKRAQFHKEMETANIPLVFEGTPANVCNEHGEVHQWEILEVREMSSGQSLNQNVCMRCGQIAGTNRYYSETGLRAIRMQQKEISELKKLKDDAEHFKMQKLEEFWSTLCKQLPKETLLQDLDRLKEIYTTGYHDFLHIEKLAEDKLRFDLMQREIRKMQDAAMNTMVSESQKLGLYDSENKKAQE